MVLDSNWAVWAERVLALAVAQYSKGTASAIELTFYACSLVLVNAFKVSCEAVCNFHGGCE